MQELVAMFAETTIPNLFLYLLQPLVIATLTDRQLCDSLHASSRSAPQQCLSVRHRWESLVLPRLLDVLGGYIAQETTFWWFQLPKKNAQITFNPPNARYRP